MNAALRYLLTELGETAGGAVGAAPTVNFDEKYVTLTFDPRAIETPFWQALSEQIDAYLAENTKEAKPRLSLD